jgi:hypothetical protein
VPCRFFLTNGWRDAHDCRWFAPAGFDHVAHQWETVGWGPTPESHLNYQVAGRGGVLVMSERNTLRLSIALP